MAWGGMSLVLTAFAVGSGMAGYGPFAIVCALLASAIAADYMTGLRNPTGIAERALFFRWLQTHRSPRAGFLFWATLMLAASGEQLLLQDALGNFEAAVYRYGIVYASVHEGEYWRLLMGGLFHSGPAHFLNNYFFLLFVGTLAWGLIGSTQSIVIFGVGCIVGALAQMRFGAAGFDAYFGVSAGIFALHGAPIACAVLDNRLAPKGFLTLLVGIFVISAAGSELLSAKAATAAHMAGFAVGALLAMTMRISASARTRLARREPA